MNRQIAMVVAGFVTTLAVIGGTVAAAQSGVLSTSTTTIQANGEINVPKTVAREPEVTATAAATDTPDVEIITKTEVMPIQYITRTVVVEKRDTSRENALLAKLNEAYKQIKDRDAAYQAKLQEAYNQLAAAQAAASAPAPVAASAPAQADNAQNSAPVAAPAAAPAVDPAPAAQPAHQEDNHQEDHKPEVHKPEDHQKP